VSLNRRESYSYQKMNASDFFDCCLKRARPTRVIVAAYRNRDIFGVDVSNFVCSRTAAEKSQVQLGLKYLPTIHVETQSRSGNSNLKQIFAGPCRRRN
jgi:hypothetical protein